ncbi:hypothetical protein [Mixta intestinalis]|uniref:Uncharacterized protein n=1 Tax=Mixta intestinalis TaxID=1615494 RepID=A0A6P1Q7T4_9GAMM|nr:hypothetical protein [Mixta intestinalis]QHM74028.1 hypothetical protein C7M51_04389 [Mixta intestinalis]
MSDNKIRFRHAEHCGWMIFTERTVTCFGRDIDSRIPDLKALGYGIKKLYCKPGLIPDDGYITLLGEALRRLLEIAPGDTFALNILSRLGTGSNDSNIYIEITEIDALPTGSAEGGLCD